MPGNLPQQPGVIYFKVYPICAQRSGSAALWSAANEAVGWKRRLGGAPFHLTSTVTKQLEPRTWQYWGLHLPAQRLRPSLGQPVDGQKGLCDKLANFPMPARVPA